MGAAAVRVAPEMNAQAVANTLWAYATLDCSPEEKALIALGAAAVRVAPEINAQAVANTLRAYAALFAVFGVRLLSCYPSLCLGARLPGRSH